MLRFLRSGTGHTRTIWWAVAIITIFTFVGGFIFLFGARPDSLTRRRSDGAVGAVNGMPISGVEYSSALTDQRDNYHRQFGIDPAERDEKMLEVQAWRTLVTQRLLADQARALGLRANDHEIVVALETSPPSQITRIAAFQTDGKFDVSKYQQALRNPNQDWSGIEDLVKEQLPVRKLQERLMASVKLTEGELRQAFRERSDRLDAIVLLVAPPDSLKVPAPTEADLTRAYEEFKGRFSAGTRVQLEVLTIPRKYGTEEVRGARELAAGLVRRARGGEDYGQLAKDYSEGPGAANGGIVPRVLQLADFGAELAPRMLAMKPGDITDPIEEQGRFLIFKLLERSVVPGSPAPGFKIAQIIVRVRAEETSLRDQYADALKIRSRAGSQGLGAAASEKGLTTTRTAFYDYSSPPQQLFEAPEAADWGLSAKLKEVSPVFQGLEDFVITQVASRHEGGPPTREELADPLRQIAQIESRLSATQGRVNAIAAEVSRGQTLENAAKAHGFTAFAVTGLTRQSTDPRLAGEPEVVGAMFAASPGRLVGPLRTLSGWYLAKVSRIVNGTPAEYDTLKAKISNEILQRRQQAMFSGYLGDLRNKAKVIDQRTEAP